MSTWAQILSTGRGTARYRLEIEGWPEVFVTDERITFATNKATRTVLPGLLHDGLNLSERIVMREATTTPNSMIFKLRPTRGSRTATQSTDPLTTAFTQFPKAIGFLTSNVDSNDTTGWTLAGGGGLTNGTYYHIGTETIYCVSWAGQNITRTHWGTAPQSHHYSPNATRSQDVHIYARPPTMEGRRCRLYAYGDDDAVAGNGTCIWRGIVASDPKLDADGITWIINAQPVTRVLKQNIAGAFGVAHPIGIFHNNSCVLRVATNYDGTPSPLTTEAVKVPNWAINQDALFVTIDALLESYRATMAAAGAPVTSLTIGRSNDGAIRVRAVVTAAFTKDFSVLVSSLIFGGTIKDNGDGAQWRKEGSTAAVDGIGTDLISSSGTWYVTLWTPGEMTHGTPYDYTWDGELGVTPLGRLAPASNKKRWNYTKGGGTGAGADASLTPWRMYIDQNWDFPGVVGASVLVSDSIQDNKTMKIAVSDTVSSFNYIEVDPIDIGMSSEAEKDSFEYRAAKWGFVGLLTDQTELTLIRDYGSTTVVGFLANLKSTATEYANDGDTPFITDEDLSTWAVVWPPSPAQQEREYQFTKTTSVESVLAAELQFCSAFMRLTATGTIGAVHYPQFTDSTACDTAHTLTTATILTPQNGEGMWPRWEPQRDGRVTEVVIVPGGPVEKAHEYRFRLNSSIPISKTRGASRAEIRPLSYPSGLSLNNPNEFNDAESLADRFLSMFSREYAAVTVAVSYVHFSVLCGDVVSVTHPLIPDGLGNRGVSGRRGFVIERKWNLDPAQKGAGELTIMIPLVPDRGYAPAGVITAQTNTSGNIWDLTLSLANTFNIALAPSGSVAGQVLDSFAVNDYIRLVKCDTLPAATSAVVGTITALNAAAGTCTVSLGAVWTPSTLVWRLEFDTGATGRTTNQYKYAYVAGTDGLDAAGLAGDQYQ